MRQKKQFAFTCGEAARPTGVSAGTNTVFLFQSFSHLLDNTLDLPMTQWMTSDMTHNTVVSQ